jgi:DNA (cytosine-5)-methyltransferase 1
MRLMDFDDEDYFKIKELGISNTQIYHMAGNSIVVAVLEEIFKNLLREKG